MEQGTFGVRQVAVLLSLLHLATAALAIPYILLAGGPIKWIPFSCALVLTSAGGIVAWRASLRGGGATAVLRIIPFAFGALGFGMSALGTLDSAYLQGTLFVCAFTWIGAGHPRWTSTKMAPLAMITYFAPVIGREGREATVLVLSAFVNVGLAVLVGEAMSWVTGRLRSAEQTNAERLRGMEGLLDAASVLALQLDDEGASNLVAAMGGSIVGADSAIVLARDPAGGFMELAKWDPLGRRADAVPVRLSKGGSIVMEEALVLGRSVVLSGEDVPKCLRAAGNPAMLATPLRGAVEPIGFIVAFLDGATRIDPFTLQLARALALQAGLAIERVWSRQVLLEAALRDELTGLGNRRHATALLGDLQAGDALAILDLDRFKELNDERGHQAGDDALRQVGQFLQTWLRDEDLAARYGGEEFVLVFRKAGQHGVLAADRLREGWARCAPPVTFSVGVAVHEGGVSPADTLSRADEALYQAKALGRDRVCGYSPSGERVAVG